MSKEQDGARSPLQHTRQVTIDALMEHFANDVMDVDEFELRVGAAHSASTSDELKELLRDLPGGGDLPAVVGARGSTMPAHVSDYSVTSADQVKEKQFVVAAMAGTVRKGRWAPARKNYAVCVMGGVELDFREAILGPGVTEVQVFTMWGGVEIIVPPGLNVESHGIALMGGFEHAADSTLVPDPGAPTLRITGVALMAGVDISVRHAGESARDARRRRRLERREKKHRLGPGGSD